VVLYLFHATQSPITPEIRNEKDGRKIFYGMMIVEGVIAMIWAAAAMSLMNGEDLNVLLANEGLPGIVHKIATVFWELLVEQLLF
jgi:carbon starvation protein CstA